MKNKLLSLWMAITMLLSCSAVVFAAAKTTTSGNFVPSEADALPFLCQSSYGVDVIWKNPSTAPITTTVTLYTQDGTAVAIDGNPATNVKADWTTANAWCVKSFYGLSNTETYYAVLEMTDGSNSGTVTFPDITPTGYKNFNGYAFGRAAITHYAWGQGLKYAHDLVDYQVDTQTYRSGTSALKVRSYGFQRDENVVGDRGDINSTLYFNGIAVIPESYIQYQLSYKGNATIGLDTIDNATVISTKTEIDANGWTNVTKIIKSGTGTSSVSIYPKILIKCHKDKTVWFDDMTLKAIDDYDETTGAYTTVGNNLLYGGGFDTEVENLRMYEPKQLTWSLSETSFFNAIKIYKNNDLIQTFNYTKTAEVRARAYTIPDANWDESATYTVKTVPCSGGGNIYADCGKETLESTGVSVSGLSEITIDNYNGSKPEDVIAQRDQGVMDVIWNMPDTTKSIIRTYVQLIDSDQDVVETKTITAASGQQNKTATFTGLGSGLYSAKVVIVYEDYSAGLVAITDVKPTTLDGTSTIRSDTHGFYLGGWRSLSLGTTHRELYDVKYEDELYQTGTGSVKIDFRGYLSADGKTFQKSAPGNNYTRFETQTTVDTAQYYEVSYAYKMIGSVTPIFKGGASVLNNVGNTNGEYVQFYDGETLGYTASTTDEEGWTTVKALLKPTSTLFHSAVHNEYSAGSVIWLDRYTLKKASYNEANQTYILLNDTNLISGGDFSLNVTDATIDGDGFIEWKEIDPRVIYSVSLYDSEGNFYDEVDAGTEYFYLPDVDFSKTYLLRVRTCNKNNTPSSNMTEGVVVKAKTIADVEIGELTLSLNNGVAEAKVSVQNYNLPSMDACLILAVYDGEGYFSECITDSTTLLEGAPAEELLIRTTIKSGYKVKAMLFDSLESMKPLTESVPK